MIIIIPTPWKGQQSYNWLYKTRKVKIFGEFYQCFESKYESISKICAVMWTIFLNALDFILSFFKLKSLLNSMNDLNGYMVSSIPV